ncbi:MAG: hypothetical protein ACJAX4_004692 [Clostridium sp.]|jgi:hypothetical protein
MQILFYSFKISYDRLNQLVYVGSYAGTSRNCPVAIFDIGLVANEYDKFIFKIS